MSQFTQRKEGRRASVQYLYAWSINPPDHQGEDLDLFFQGLEQPRDYYAFGDELIHGCIENLDEIDERIRALARNWDFSRIAKMDLAILRIAIYEMLYRKDIPPVVSINEAIDLGKQFSSEDSKRFINGILDRVKDSLSRPSREADTTSRPRIRTRCCRSSANSRQAWLAPPAG